MIKVKKIIAMLVSVLIFGTVFSACGKEEVVEGITQLSKAKVGDKVNYGNYEQDNNNENGKEKITWVVVAAEKGKILLVSEKVLDTKTYNSERADITWENSTVRGWLNKDFLDAAFTSKEQRKVIETTVVNPDNPKYNTPGGNETKDKLFLLSFEEAGKYFTTDELRRAKGTDFAKNNGLKLDESILYAGNSVWWLRTPGLKANHACYVNNDGVIYQTLFVDLPNFGIRPAMWVKQ
jgi:hypothetical protein